MQSDDHYLRRELYSLVANDTKIFDFLQDGSFDGLWYWDLENPDHEWMSPRFWETLGYRPSEKKHLASEWQNIIFPEDLRLALKNFEKHCADPDYPYDQIVRYLHRDGHTVWVRCRGIVIRDDTGKPSRMLGIHTDLTQIKKTEKKLRESEELFRVTMENILDPVFITDDSGTITFICPNIPHTLGYSVDEIARLDNISTIVGEGLFDLEELKRKGHIQNIDAVIACKNGEKRNYLVTVKRVSIKGGTILYVCRDITERLLMEEEHSAAKTLYKDLVETSQDLIWQCDAEGRYTYLNPAWQTALGYTPREMLGRKFSDFQDPDHGQQDNELFQAMLRENRAVTGYESVHRNRGGQPVHLVFNAKPVYDRAGNPAGTRGAAYDITWRHHAEQQLRKKEEEFRNLFERMFDGFALHEIICDPSGSPVDYRFLSVNPAFEQLTGLRAADLIGRTVREAMPDTEQHWIDVYGKVALSGEPISFESYSQELGKYFEVSAYRPAKNQFACIFLDVTQRKKAETELKQALQLNKLIIETSPIGLLVFKESGPCIMANPAAAKIADASEEQLLQLDYTEMESYRRTGILEDITTVLSCQKVIQRVVRTVNTFGREVWFNGVISSFTAAEEKYVLFLFQDIWEQKKLEQHAMQQHAEFEAIFNSITDAIIFTDTNHRIVRVNPAFTSLFNHTAEEVEGKTTQFLHADPDKENMLQEYHSGENLSLQPIIEVEYMRSSGTVFPGETLSVPVRNAQNETVGFLSVIRDVTQRKEAEEERASLLRQWQQSQKLEALGTLAGGIAHDFNNILSAVIGYAEMARDGSQSGTTVAHDLDRVLEASGRARDLVQQILSFSRQTNTERISFIPSILVKETLKMLRPTLPTTIEIIQDIDHHTSSIYADPTQINQVLMNLFTNAYHALEEKGGKLGISLKEVQIRKEDIPQEKDVEEGSFIQFSIWDTGHGIPAGIVDKIFDPFFTTKDTGKGTGMGLSIVHGIVKKYGGFTTITTAEGKGTTIKVFIPVHAEDTQVQEEQESSDVGGGKERILFIDDEEIISSMSQRMIERLGYEVTVRNSSFEALETFQNQPDRFDLVITDQTMPGMTGFDLSRRMLQIRPDIPIIICTGYSSTISKEKVQAHGIKDFALKPVSKKDFARLIRKVLDTP